MALSVSLMDFGGKKMKEVNIKVIRKIVEIICEEIERERDISITEKTKDRVEKEIKDRVEKEIKDKVEEILEEIYDQEPSPELKYFIYSRNDLLNSLERELDKFKNTVQLELNAFYGSSWQFVEQCQIKEFKEKQKEEK